MYGHFFLYINCSVVLKNQILLDQDSGMRATCLTAFHNEIKNRSCDAFYVRITKDLTVDEKRRTLNDSRNYFSDQQKEHPDLSKIK
ncbi:hypothetical protein [sulfur-oxidizing endosymbiont of Gigantopelta aegis]|uniref:hypothetical protein n=1 Tax=sulfur-oxidizing endosymbiont of Gigantopelta aegis TaxID=2794934 RepID=UPI001BE3DB2F|nr:hypothetical protein [sulfur-oxidizing endosymbiont of Gigantopelta aegis]